MNCKPGDIAIVVRCSKAPQNIGRIVRCLSLRPGPWPPSWRIDPPLDVSSEFDPWSIVDSALRPINDPGDDAVDEVLQLLPVPHKEMA